MWLLIHAGIKVTMLVKGVPAMVSGNFGRVYAGVLTPVDPTEQRLPVAIKTIKGSIPKSLLPSAKHSDEFLLLNKLDLIPLFSGSFYRLYAIRSQIWSKIDTYCLFVKFGWRKSS